MMIIAQQWWDESDVFVVKKIFENRMTNNKMAIWTIMTRFEKKNVPICGR